MHVFVCDSSDFIRRYEKQIEVEGKEDKSREKNKLWGERHDGLRDNSQSGMLWEHYGPNTTVHPPFKVFHNVINLSQIWAYLLIVFPNTSLGMFLKCS